MALVSAKEMLEKAHEGHYAVGAFNINNLEWTKSILMAAQEANSPVMLGVSEGAGKYIPETGSCRTGDSYSLSVPQQGGGHSEKSVAEGNRKDKDMRQRDLCGGRVGNRLRRDQPGAGDQPDGRYDRHDVGRTGAGNLCGGTGFSGDGGSDIQVSEGTEYKGERLEGKKLPDRRNCQRGMIRRADLEAAAFDLLHGEMSLTLSM